MYLCQVLHVGRFDVHHIEALIGVIQMPQVDTQIITGDEGFLVTAYGDGVYVVCVCIPKHTPTSCLHDLLHTSDLQGGKSREAYQYITLVSKSIHSSQVLSCNKHVCTRQIGPLGLNENDQCRAHRAQAGVWDK